MAEINGGRESAEKLLSQWRSIVGKNGRTTSGETQRHSDSGGLILVKLGFFWKMIFGSGAGVGDGGDK
ncbi:uncharacterized protein A4U43_C05F35880 [Asparagus officinalis]|uniref:Uncharacterized protein n=1 Tax=Asparagus officinalis TaxID=4686 RepID=A0A5P1EXR0_ASPOF|nr:uncharacterized protein A4U43_C05F35880 [Asparagus officinalis]